MPEEILTPEEIAELRAIKMAISKPETKKDALRLLKKAAPDADIPLLDIEDRLTGIEEKNSTEMEALKAENEKLRKEIAIDKRRAKLKEKGMNEEDIAGVEKFIAEGRTHSYDDAEVLYEASRQIADSTPNTLGRFKDSISKDRLKDLENPDWATNEAHQAIDDLRSGRVRL